ncbi:TonB-dependent receptor [Kordiimonas pumila]|uniref:TonB-dependent receptor n=1 Tax=Kordiimonas pumila TaxID=2161677 RepID=A0ABV7D2U1_9PROT|nr:TonB-dependent receptor [Kordiimonas pumila]
MPLYKFTKSLRRSILATASTGAILLTGAANAADLSGRVSDTADSLALEGALVRIQELNRRTSTAADGSFYFSGIPAGDYTVIINYIGSDPITRTVTVTEAGARLDVAYGAHADVDEIIVVKGLRGSLNSSLSKQRAADNVSNFLSADSAGNFPDQNVSEAVRRIVGLSVENDQGEGRYVVIRGLDPNLSSSSVGGVRLPSPEGGDRKVALDVIPSELLETVEVTKSLTPDMDADAIGGNVDIKTLSGFDRDGLFVKAKIEGGYNRQQEEWSPKVGLTIANKFSDKFAVAGSISYYDRKFGTDNKEIDGGWIDEDDEDQEINGLIPEELELRDYVVERKRFGAALNLDYRPSDSTDLYLRTLYSDFKDSELRNRMEMKFDEGEFDLDRSDVDGGYVYVDGIEADRDLKDRIETQKILSISGGGETRFDSFTATYSISYAKAQEAEPDRLDTSFAGEDFNSGVDFTNLLFPRSIFKNSDDLAALQDLSNYEVDSFEYSDNITEDEQIAFKLDIAKDMYWGDNPVLIKWGAKARLRDKFRDNTFLAYDGDLGDVTLNDFSTAIDYPIDLALGNGGIDGVALRDYYAANRSSFELNELDTLIGSKAVDYDAEEDIYASYIMGRIDMGGLRITGGVRYEYTDFKTTSNFVQVGEVVVVDGNGDPVLDGDGDPETDDISSVTEVSGAQDYSHWLPSLNLRYEAREDLVLRAAYFRSVVRPNIDDVVPTGEIEFEEELDGGEIVRTTEGTIGNENLVPMTAHNFDVSVEWYPNNDAVLSVGAFYKDISNFVIDRTVEDVTVNGVFFNEVVRPYNGDKATIKGIEVNYQQALTFLPGLLNGLIVGVNYTYVDSNATVDLGDEIREIALPKTSKHVANLVLGYEKGPITLRAAMTYRDAYLDELNAAGFGDRYALSHTQWDFSASYDILENVKLYGEVSNANDEPFRAVHRTEDGDYLMQHEQYDWTANMGVKVKF